MELSLQGFVAVDWRRTPVLHVHLPSVRHLHQFPGVESHLSPGMPASSSCERRWNYRQQDLEMGTFSFFFSLMGGFLDWSEL